VFFASFTDLSVGVQTAVSAPFVSLLLEIFTGEGAGLKVRVPLFEETHEGAQVSGRNIWRPPWGREGSFAPQLGGSTRIRPRLGGLVPVCQYSPTSLRNRGQG